MESVHYRISKKTHIVMYNIVRRSRWRKYKDSLVRKGKYKENLKSNNIRRRKKRLNRKLKGGDVINDEVLNEAVEKKVPSGDWIDRIIMKTRIPPAFVDVDEGKDSSSPRVELEKGGYKPIARDVMQEDTVVRTDAPLVIHHPSRIIVAGPSGSGKSTWVRDLILHRDKCFSTPPREILWFYKVESAVKHLVGQLPESVQYFQGLPEREAIQEMDSEIPRLIVIDDQEDGVNSSNTIVKDLFTVFSHHLNISVVFVVQNIYLKARLMKSITDQGQYLIHTKAAKGSQQIRTLGGQIFGKNGSRFVNWAMNHAFENDSPFAYLLFDMHNLSKNWQRLRSSVFPGECNLFFIKKGTVLDKTFHELNRV